jgi:hypothetical protein
MDRTSSAPADFSAPLTLIEFEDSILQMIAYRLVVERAAAHRATKSSRNGPPVRHECGNECG